MTRSSVATPRKSARISEKGERNGGGGQKKITEFLGRVKGVSSVGLGGKKMFDERRNEKREDESTTGTKVNSSQAKIRLDLKKEKEFLKSKLAQLDELQQKTDEAFKNNQLEEAGKDFKKVSSGELDFGKDQLGEVNFRENQQEIRPTQLTKDQVLTKVKGVQDEFPTKSTEEIIPNLDPPPLPLLNPFKSTTSHFSFDPRFPLNEKFSFYEKVVFHLDSLCVLAAGRSQPCIFHRIQKSLQVALNKTVDSSILGRIKTVWPDAYEFRPTETIVSGRRIESVALEIKGLQDGMLSNDLQSILAKRRSCIRTLVQKHLLNEHFKFVQGLGALKVIQEEIKGWHVKFDQDKIDDFDASPLFDSTGAKSEKELTMAVIKSSPTGNSASLEESQKRSSSLLERIREKERLVNLDKMYKRSFDPQLSALPVFAQKVRFLFSSAQKTSMFLADFIDKIKSSGALSGTEILSDDNVLSRLELLITCVPGWIGLVESAVGNIKLLKILDKNISLKEILDKIESFIIRAKRVKNT